MSGRAIQELTDARFVISLALAATAGAAGPQASFTTLLIVFNVLSSTCCIFLTRFGRSIAYAELPAYPPPKHRRDLCLVLGVQHHRRVPVCVADPCWLGVLDRGLHTGVLIVGAISTGESWAPCSALIARTWPTRRRQTDRHWTVRSRARSVRHRCVALRSESGVVVRSC
jgi:hypothetical protein